MNEVDYKLLVEQVQAFADTENDFVPLFSNVSALLYEALEDLNWVGFYLMDKGSLLLGPFQGKTACIRIQPGRLRHRAREGRSPAGCQRPRISRAHRL